MQLIFFPSWFYTHYPWSDTPNNGQALMKILASQLPSWSSVCWGHYLKLSWCMSKQYPWSNMSPPQIMVDPRCKDWPLNFHYNSVFVEDITWGCLDVDLRGRPLMIWGGPGGNREKKNLRGPSPGKKKFSKGICAEKINPFLIFPPPPPKIINGRSLNSLNKGHDH